MDIGCSHRCSSSYGVNIGSNSAFNMNIRNLSINIGFSRDFFMSVCLSSDILMNVSLSRDVLMLIFFSSNVLMNIGLSGGPNLSSVVIRIYDNGGSMDKWGRGSGGIVGISQRGSIIPMISRESCNLFSQEWIKMTLLHTRHRLLD